MIERKIVYAPDFLVNAGGLIHVVTELDKNAFKKIWIKEQTEKLYSTSLHVLDKAEKESRLTQEIAEEIAIARIQSIKNVRFDHNKKLDCNG